MTTVLKVTDLRMEFGGLVAVKDVSRGRIRRVRWPYRTQWCGKSTTFNCISGLLNHRTHRDLWTRRPTLTRPDSETWHDSNVPTH